MPSYRLTKPARVIANGHPTPQLFPAGSVIDYAGVPSLNMTPLDAAATAAVEQRRREQPYGIAKNGLQPVNLNTGKTMTARFGGRLK